MTTETATDTEMKELMGCLNDLHRGYLDTRELLSTQIQAVVGQDIARLDNLIDRQMTRYGELQDLEARFKDRLVRLFQKYYPESTHPSLTGLLDAIEEPTEDIDRLRTDVYDTIHQTEQLRSRLVKLLSFASDYNSRSIEVLSGLAGKTYGNYGNHGQVEPDRSAGLGLNRTV